jgi:hypothetical protein
LKINKNIKCPEIDFDGYGNEALGAAKKLGHHRE